MSFQDLEALTAVQYYPVCEIDLSLICTETESHKAEKMYVTGVITKHQKLISINDCQCQNTTSISSSQCSNGRGTPGALRTRSVFSSLLPGA
jgi:hypothetical protein